MPDNNIAINELLTYTTYYMNNSNLTNIKKLIANFYNQDDISQAKNLLWKLKS